MPNNPVFLMSLCHKVYFETPEFLPSQNSLNSTITELGSGLVLSSLAPDESYPNGPR